MTEQTTPDDAERGDMCIGSVHFDLDSVWADVQTISDMLEDFGYGTRMTYNNTQLVITRDKEFKPNYD